MVKVLIVDDNESFRRLNAEFIKLDGHQVITAASGRETLEIVHEEQPDVVLLDIMMPGIDGYEICRKIKGDPTTENTTVIMITALPPSERFKSIQAGADEHISKPIESRQLRDMIKRLAARKKRSDKNAEP